MTFPELESRQLAIGLAVVFALAIVGGLAWGFGQQFALLRQMWAEEARLEQAVATKQARHEELAAEREYVNSDEYVEEWAREEAKMAKPGEVVVIPMLGAGDEEPTPEAAPEQPFVPNRRPFWVRWWRGVRDWVVRP